MTISLTPLQKQKIKDAALAAYPLEMCGICTADDFIELDNMSIEPERSFSFDPVQYAKWVDQVICIVHSHNKKIDEPEVFDLRTPSKKDRLNQRQSNKPWLIVGCEGYEVSEPIEIPRTRSRDYVGRHFMWFVNDCYTLVQDYYYFEKNISLMDHADDFDWTKPDAFSGIFEPYIQQAGFVSIDHDAIENGDLVVLSSMQMMNNHLGIYDNGDILHQEGVSLRVPYTAFRGRVNRVLRYVG
jgi:proteasome lid subunit RPN8/RPN11